MEFDLAHVATEIPDEDAAYQLLEEIRWDGRPVCPHCGSVDVNYLTPRGDGRKTRTGAVTKRRVWKCRDCAKQFSVLVGTIFQGTRVPMRKWLLAIAMMSASKNGTSAHELHRSLGVIFKTAWFMLHRIREAMTRDPLAGMLTGTVQADETFIGGKPKNMHAKKRRQMRRGGPGDKQPVLTLITEHEARSQTIPNVTGDTLAPAIRSHVAPTATLHTDGYMPYRKIGTEYAAHGYVDHTAGEYVRGDVTTNRAESFFAQFKRSIDGTHHGVSPAHLHRYLAEFDFRYTTRKMTDSDRAKQIVRQSIGKTLRYRDPAA